MIEYRIRKTYRFAAVRSVTARAHLDREVDGSRVRTARLLDRLLPGTQRWAESLPLSLLTAHLVRAFPRIANRLAIAYQDPTAVQDVLCDVLNDRRGGRQGLPRPVPQELLRLRALIEGGRAQVQALARAARYALNQDWPVLDISRVLR